MTPQEIILRKSLVLNGSMSSADWELMSAGIKDRAFWVSRCESLDFVDTCHKTISDGSVCTTCTPDGNCTTGACSE